MARKVAITIAGAVSLGSYEAGVVFEVLDAVAQHNKWADANGPEDRIEVDVLTGASAGGMTAAMIAQRLLFDGAAMAEPYDNPLYNAWVRDVDIVGLLARDPDEPATHSVLSSNRVIKISDDYLLGRYPQPAGSPPSPSANPHAALPADGTLQLGLALSNLNGVDYARPTRSGGEFVYTEHGDQLLRTVTQATDDRKEFWEPIRAAAVACGAFPVAFRVQDLLRDIADFDSPYLIRALWGGKLSRYFTYTDGGLFQNQPLGMAKNLVDCLPGGHLGAGQRAYLFIAPRPKASESVAYTASPDADAAKFFGTSNANYKALILRMADSVLGQSEFQDWVMAEQLNDKLHTLDDRAGQLQVLFHAKQLTAAMTRPVTDALLKAFFNGSQETRDSGLGSLADARTQLGQQYSGEYARFGADRDAADAWLDAVLVLELAAGLHWKEEMLIYDFVAEPAQLASYNLQAFEGFFDVAYRKHDYDYGRSVAQQKLLFYKNQVGAFANLHWTPKPIDPIDPKLNNLDMSRVDPAKREQVRTQLCAAAEELLKELELNLPERKLVMFFVIEKQVRKMLAL